MARYTYSPGYIDSPAVQERDLNGDSDFGDTNEVIYYHSNTLHSIYALTDGSENVVERCRSAKPSYGSFTWGETPPMREGEPVVTDADWSADADATSDAENPYRYTARRLDAESGLMQYRNREYRPQLGRFLQRDTIVALSLYQFCKSSPLNWRDPTGRSASSSRPPGSDVLDKVDAIKEVIQRIDDAKDAFDYASDAIAFLEAVIDGDVEKLKEMAETAAWEGIKRALTKAGAPAIVLRGIYEGQRFGSELGGYIAEQLKEINTSHSCCECYIGSLYNEPGEVYRYNGRLCYRSRGSHSAGGEIFVRVPAPEEDWKDDGFLDNLFEVFKKPAYTWAHCGTPTRG